MQIPIEIDKKQVKIAKASLDGFSFLCYNVGQAEKRLKYILVY